MLIEGQVGPQTASVGTTRALRLTGDGSVGTQFTHARFQEAVLRGRVYSGSTAATGAAPGTAVGTTAAFSLFNPKSSGYSLVVLRASMGYVSGTLGAGVVHYLANVNPAAADVTGTPIVQLNALLGGPIGVAKPFTTATLPVAPALLRPAWSLTALLATTAVQPYLVRDDLDGEFVVMPGSALSLHATAAAGTSPLVVFGMTWEEVAAF